MSKNNTTEAADTQLIAVTLAAPHTHDNQWHQKGDIIHVTPAQATWLARMGIVKTSEASDEHAHDQTA